MRPSDNRYMNCYIALSFCLIVSSACSKLRPSRPENDDNTPPSAFFTVTPDSGSVLVPYFLNASSSSDAEDELDELRIRWDWDGNGSWDTPLDTVKQITHRFTEAALYTVIMEVRDTGDLADTTQQMVSVSGNLLWKFDTPGMNMSSPAIGVNGTIYFGSGRYICALNPDGTLRWNYLTEGSVYSSPAVDDNGRIFVGSEDSYLYALDSDGTLFWKYQTGSQIESSPAIGADGTIYVCSDQLYSIDNTGSLKWSNPEGGGYSSPAIDADGSIYVHTGGMSSGELLAFSPDGAMKWSFSTNGGMTSPAIGTDGAIYVGSSNYYIYALEPDGTLRWEFKTATGMLSTSPAIGNDGSIYVGTVYGRIYALNPNGSLKWRFSGKTGVGAYTSSPAIGSDGTIYFYKGHHISAVSVDGELLWEYPIGHMIFWANRCSPTVTESGVIYIGGMDGFFYALQSNSSGLTQSAWPKFRCNPQNTGRRLP